jgi:hypothetical protein
VSDKLRAAVRDALGFAAPLTDTVTCCWCITKYESYGSAGVPPYPLIQYPWFQLSAVYHCPKKVGKLIK